MGLLFVDFLFMLRFWGRRVYRQPHLLKRYGLDRSRQNGINLLKGLGFGLLQTFFLFGLQGVLGWLVWQTPSMPLPRLVLEGSLTALGVGLAEELVFRGWLLDELERDYRPNVALWVSAAIFASLHFIKPLSEVIRMFPQFPGLLILGLMLVWAKRSHGGSLGISIGIHAGLVWAYYIISVGNLIQYSGAVPEWITGIDRNPLAGIMGVLLLSVAALGIKRFALKRSSYP